jgi:hypothetical protein
MPRISVNISWVGPKQFTTADETTVANTLNYTRAVYASVGVLVDRVEDYEITNADAGGYAVIDQASEAEFLTVEWTVRTTRSTSSSLSCTSDRSPVSGPCDKGRALPSHDWHRRQARQGPQRVGRGPNYARPRPRRHLRVFVASTAESAERAFRCAARSQIQPVERR